MNISTPRYTISLVNHGFFRLDGGAMFGSVPKNLWQKIFPSDSENCIRLATRSLLLKGEGRCILVDVGNGEKWNEKLRVIFGIENTPAAELPFKPEEITDVVLTHLHFDHAGGISRYDDQGTLVPTFTNARIHLQRANYENALQPNLRERASYLAENVGVLREQETYFIEGDVEILPDIFVHRVDGHTVGQQTVEVRGGKHPIFFPTDLCPTSRHLPVPYNMGYDICTSTILNEKEEYLERAYQERAIVVFEHDPDLPAAMIGKNDKGHFCVDEAIEIEG